MSNAKILKELYENPSFGLIGKSKFKLKVKALHPNITNKEINDFVDKQELQQVNTAKPFKGYFKIVAPPYTYQCDIFYLKQYKTNNNNKFFLWYLSIFLVRRPSYIRSPKIQKKKYVPAVNIRYLMKILMQQQK